MNLKHLTDEQLQADAKILVRREREILTQVLYHLKEIESRKLYAAYGFKSLFEYACLELKYSSDQAYRRIDAMRLLKEIPEIARKLDSGELSLSNINQAQKHFKETKVMTKEMKIDVLKKLCHKSVRDAQKEILKLTPIKTLPEETKRQVTSTHSFVGFNMSAELEKKLESIKSLLGPKSYNLSMAELIDIMADLSKEKLLEQKFGKKLVAASNDFNKFRKLNVQDLNSKIQKNSAAQRKTKYLKGGCSKLHGQATLNVQSELFETSNRYVSKQLKYRVWKRDGEKCRKCNSSANLQFDHILPLALGGKTHLENLRLLCFNCNQRSRIEAKL